MSEPDRYSLNTGVIIIRPGRVIYGKDGVGRFYCQPPMVIGGDPETQPPNPNTEWKTVLDHCPAQMEPVERAEKSASWFKKFENWANKTVNDWMDND